MLKCANCGGGHLANFNQYTQMHKTKINVYKNKILGKSKTKIVEPCNK